MSLPQTTKALRIESKGAKAILTDIPLSKPGKNQILVKMAYSPINPADILTIQGIYAVGVNPPHGVGLEGSGVVAALGEDLKYPFQVGDKVHVFGLGTFSEYFVTESERVVKVQEGLDLTDAASHYINPVTAYQMGEFVLKGGHKAAIHTIGGSALGKMLIRYFKHKGIKLINIVRREDAVKELLDEGADFVLNSQAPDFEEKLKALAEKESATACFEPILGDFTGKILRNMPNGSTLFIYGALSGPKINDLNVEDFLFKGKTITGLWMAAWVEELIKKGEYDPVKKEVYPLLSNIFTSNIHKVFSFSDFFEALDYYEKNAAKGKVLIQLNKEF